MMVNQCKKARANKKKSKPAAKGPTITIPKASTSAKSQPKPKPAYQGANFAVSNSVSGPIVPQDETGMVDDAIQGLLGLGRVAGGGEGLESGDEVEVVGLRKRKNSEIEGGEDDDGEEEEEDGEDNGDGDESSEEGPEDKGEFLSFFCFRDTYDEIFQIPML